MKVKLINCVKLFRDTFPPYGLGVINAFLNNNSIKSSIFDLDIVVKHHNSIGKNPVDLDYLRKNYDRIYEILKTDGFDEYLDSQFDLMLKKINLNGFDVVGMNSHDDEIYIPLYLAKKIKEKNDCTIMIGGSHVKRVSADRLMYLIDNLRVDYVDYFAQQFPHEFFLNLSKEEALHDKARKKPEIFSDKKIMENVNKEKDYKSDYSEFSIPLYNKEHLELYKIDIKKIKSFYPRLSPVLIDKLEKLHNGKPVLILPYIFTKGCTNNCAFCFASLQKPLKLDTETVLSNIKAMEKRYKCKNFYFLNNNLTMDKEYAINLFKRLTDETDIRWSDASSIKGLDTPTLKLMSRSGCIQLLFGLESASQRMLKYVHKNVDYNEINYYTTCFKKCDENNIWVVVDLIAGFPYETRDDVKKSIDYIEKNRGLINGVFVLRFCMFDTSVMFQNPEKYGLEMVNDESVRNAIVSKFGKNIDVYRKVYYRDFVFNETGEGGLNWAKQQRHIRKVSRFLNDYVLKNFKTCFYIHYPIFFLYNTFKGDKKEIVKFLVS